MAFLANSKPSVNIPLRILPLGDSITWGYLSTDGNGYRQDLLTLLTATNRSVTYIGSQTSGNMSNPQNEGHPGATISQIAGYANASLPSRPNVILLMAGTNDIAGNIDVTTAPERLGSLIDECTNACPDAVVLVAQLTPAAGEEVEGRIVVFNEQVPKVVESKKAGGKKVAVVDMSAYVAVENLKDGLHPNDYGYGRMAQAWFDGLTEAAKKGWVTPPV